jgi:Tfp pilus assembly protein PilF
VRLRWLSLLLCAAFLAAGEDPFEAPPDLAVFARQHTNLQMSTAGKLHALLKAFLDPPEAGGLGITYDNAYTRTPVEVWRDRKANCLSMTLLFVEACRALDIEARYAEPIRITHWRREGGTVRYERHLVAMIPTGSLLQDYVADFSSEVRRDVPLLQHLDRRRVKAFFLGNRAVELLGNQHVSEALVTAQRAVDADPELSVTWNILGVIQQNLGQDASAEASYRKALATDPKDGAPCGNLEGLLRIEGRLAEAQVYRERGLEIRKGDPYFQAFLAEEALDAKHYEEAEARVRQAIKILPQEVSFYLLQVRIALAQGQQKDAVRALEQARKWAQPDMRSRFDTKLAILKGLLPS